MTKQSTSRSWRQNLVKGQPVALGRERREPHAFRRARRKDGWTKKFKEHWEPLADWKLPKKIREVREGSDELVSVLHADLGGNLVKAKLVPGETIPGQVEKIWRIRPGWDREVYGRSVHDEFREWRRRLLTGPDGHPFVAYEGELYRLLGERYSSRVPHSDLEAVIQKLIDMRFECRYRPTPPTPLIEEKPKKPVEKKAELGAKKRKLRQTGESRRTKKAKRERLLSLPTDEYIGNGGHITLSIPPDPETDFEVKQVSWEKQRKRWCQGLSAIARRYGVQVDWFMEITNRRCRITGQWIETPHYHLLWRRHRRDRFTFPEVRGSFLRESRKLAESIWPINARGLYDRPIINEHHMRHLQRDYLAKSLNSAKLAWGRFFGQMNSAQTKITAMLTKEQHFALRRVQARAVNHPSPNIAVDLAGRMTSADLLKMLDIMGVPYKIECNQTLAEDLVTVVSSKTPDTSATGHSIDNETIPLVYNECTYTEWSKAMNAALPTNSQATCGYRLISPCEVVLREGYPLYRSLDAIPDTRRIDLGEFTLDLDQVEHWAEAHPLERPISDEDQYAMIEAIRRSRRVLLPLFVDQHGKLLAGAESVRAVAKIHLEEDAQIERIPVVCIYIDSKAAEAELILALNNGYGGGVTQSQLNERRRAAVRALLIGEHDGTDRLIAGLCGLRDSSVVKKIRLELECKGLIDRRREFIDRRGFIQKRTEAYDGFGEERQADTLEVSGPDASEPTQINEREHHPITGEDPKHCIERTHSICGISLFLTKWFQVYGDRPVWPEELEVIAAECSVEIPNESGTESGFTWTLYPKPDGSDWVFTLRDGS